MKGIKRQGLADSSLTVSVCVLSYNLEKYISDALDSILSQKVNFKYNIVIGDDCSTDNTHEIIRKYADQHPDKFILLLHDNNLGMLANFAKSLKACTGKYIAILDGDDYWTDPLKLQKQVDFLESHPDYSMVFHNADLHDYTQGEIAVRPFNVDLESREYTASEILMEWVVTTCSVLCVNKEQYRYIENKLWFPVQDLPLYLCCAKFGKIYYMEETMCVYRRLPTGSQNSEEFRSPEIHLRFIEYIKSLSIDFRGFLSKESIERASAIHFLNAARKSKNTGNSDDYKRYLALAMGRDSQYVYDQEIQSVQNSIQQQAENRYKILKNHHDKLMMLVTHITQISIWRNPIKKYHAYKKMLRAFHEMQSTVDENV
jgi:glycosyltransferase involved in cell wall biosynthesis